MWLANIVRRCRLLPMICPDTYIFKLTNEDNIRPEMGRIIDSCLKFRIFERGIGFDSKFENSLLYKKISLKDFLSGPPLQNRSRDVNECIL